MRVLVVDDDPLLRHVIKLLLRSELPEAQIFEAATLADARSTLISVGCDLVITDVAMERPDAGWEIAELARARGIAVVLLSGQERAASLGKPLSVPLLRKSELARVRFTDAVECAIACQAGRVERIPA
jgi:CheY-like chemotaxis protein